VLLLQSFGDLFSNLVILREALQHVVDGLHDGLIMWSGNAGMLCHLIVRVQLQHTLKCIQGPQIDHLFDADLAWS